MTIFSRHTTLAVVAEAINLETKILAAEPEEALVLEEGLVPEEALAIGVVLTVPMLPKVKIAASSKHDTRHFLAFPTTFGMSI
jgi:hypothetical protein